MKNKSQNASNTGLGLCNVLLIIFVVLKLLKLINWTWPIVLIPLWISLGFALIKLIVFFILYFKG